jgi:hypothetical protein
VIASRDVIARLCVRTVRCCVQQAFPSESAASIMLRLQQRATVNVVRSVPAGTANRLARTLDCVSTADCNDGDACTQGESRNRRSLRHASTPVP